MTILLAAGLTAIGGYLLGSLCFGIITTRFLDKVDIRSMGSGNAGMTNVLRSVGVRSGIITAIGDFGKGVAAVALGRFLFAGAGVEPRLGAYLAALCVLLGHMHPLYFGFRGGKGIMTGASIILLTDWRVFFVVIAVFVVTFLTSRIISLSSILAAATYPVATLAIGLIGGGEWRVSTLIAFVMAVVVIYKHKDNIGRLLAGTEAKLSIKKEKN